MSQFATVEEFQTFTGETLDEAGEARATLLLQIASADIQNYTRQTISAVASHQVSLRGNWSPRLRLPERPVTAVTAVAIDGQAVTSYERVRDVLVLHDTWQPQFERPASAWRFWGGTAVTVEVTYAHGYATIPDDIKGVCLSVASRKYDNPGNKVMEQLGDYRYQIAPGTAANWLTDEDKDRLRRYRR